MKRECGQVLSAVTIPVVPTGNILSDVRQLGPHCIAAWCPRCRKATEYRYLRALTEAA